jgi:hypothetical protein
VTSILETYIANKLTDASEEIAGKLIPKYQAEFTTTLERVANGLVKGLAKDLVIEDKGDFLSVTINNSEIQHD